MKRMAKHNPGIMIQLLSAAILRDFSTPTDEDVEASDEDEVTGKSTACCKSEGWDGWVGGWSEGRRDERRGVGHGGARRGRECDDASQAWAC